MHAHFVAQIPCTMNTPCNRHCCPAQRPTRSRGIHASTDCQRRLIDAVVPSPLTTARKTEIRRVPTPLNPRSLNGHRRRDIIDYKRRVIESTFVPNLFSNRNFTNFTTCFIPTDLFEFTAFVSRGTLESLSLDY